MTEQEKAVRAALADRPTEGPWQVRLGSDRLGGAAYHILLHTHAAICVAAKDYYLPGYFPDADEDGYYQPDDRLDCLPHGVATARYIAAANPAAMQAILDELDYAREDADRWEKRARSLGWSDTAGD